MEALTAYAKYTGSYEKWCQIRKHYSLRWTNGDESLQAMHRFFNPGLTLEVMLDKIRKMMQVLPKPMAVIIRHAVLTGLRPAEAVESVKLLNMQKWKNPEMHSVQYYNPERQCLEHYKFPHQFLRATKKAFISYITKEQLSGIALLGPETPGYDAIRSACKRRKIDMDMRLCRKMHGSWLHSHRVTAEEVDFLQGRVSPSVFSRHYLTPENSLRTRVLEALEKLSSQLVNPKIEGTK
jgi:intergrase/recombinase